MRLIEKVCSTQVLTALRAGAEVQFSALVASTSGSGATCSASILQPLWAHQAARHLAAKPAKGKGKPAPPPADAPPKVRELSISEKARVEAGALLKERRLKMPPLLPGVSETGRELVDPNKAPKESALRLDSLGVEDVARMVHGSMKALQGGQGDVQLNVFEFGDPLQSATVAASEVADALECGFNWNRITQYFTRILPDSPFVAGFKLQIKGRLSGKAGKAAKKIWEVGQVTAGTFTEAVDYAEASALTRAGWIGVKVWIRYKPGVVPDGYKRRVPLTDPMTLQQLLDTPRTPLPRTPSAWWAAPGPLQPAYCGTAGSYLYHRDPNCPPGLQARSHWRARLGLATGEEGETEAAAGDAAEGDATGAAAEGGVGLRG